MVNRTVLSGVGVLAIVVVLYVIQVHNYLLFHAFIELFSIVIAFGIFVIAWNGRRYTDGDYLQTLGVAYLFIGLLDLLHTLGYRGMNIFTDYDYYANQLWVAARYMESITLLVVVVRIRVRREPRISILFATYSFVTALLIYSIFFSDVFPPGFVEGVGQTRFKVVSEYVINAILVVTLILAFRSRSHFRSGMFGLIAASIATTIVAEFAFTFYVSNYGISNMIGHYAKAVSFYLIYRAVIQRSIAEPYHSIFEQLTRRTTELDNLNGIHRDVFAIISHDLRGPFGAMRSFVALLSEGWDSYTPSERGELLTELSRIVDRTYFLTENLLQWAESETKRVVVPTMDFAVSGLVDEVVESLQPQAARKGVRIVPAVDAMATVSADPDTVQIVLRNVLSNAIKYSNRDGAIEFKSGNRNGYTEIAVVDHGCGMDTDAANTVVRRYASTRGTAGEKGTGLGLALVHRYAASNHGEVRFEDTTGGGTTVRLWLPSAAGRVEAIR